MQSYANGALLRVAVVLAVGADGVGKRIAVVALARRVAGILYAMWRDPKIVMSSAAREALARALASVIMSPRSECVQRQQNRHHVWHTTNRNGLASRANFRPSALTLWRA